MAASGRRKRVLLTGAGGFIGSQVARVLAASPDVGELHAVVRDRANAPRLAAIAKQLILHEGDLLDPTAVARVVAEAQPDLCIHAAWYAVPGKYLEAPENLAHVGAGIELAERLAEVGCKRLVGLGTCFEYELGDARTPLREWSPTGPRFLYSTSKLALHDILSEHAALSGTSFAWCRIFYQYGPMEAPERLVPHVIDRLLGGKVAETSEGAQVRDFLHVADVGDAIAAVALAELEGVVNVGSGVPVTVRDVVSAIARICEAEDRVRFGAVAYRPGDPMYVCADVEKLRSTGFEPRFDLESGLRDTVRARREERI